MVFALIIDPNNHAENNAPTRMNSNLNHAPVNHAEINHRMNSNLNLVSPSFQSVMNTIPTRLKHVESENSDVFFMMFLIFSIVYC